MMEDMFKDDDLMNINGFLGFQGQSSVAQELFLKSINPQSNLLEFTPHENIKKINSINNFGSNKNNKNKYINKIHQMSKDVKGQQIDQRTGKINNKSRKTSRSFSTLNPHQRFDNESDSVGLKSNEKLHKNRLSAKESRQRKKLYIDLLQKQIVKLEFQKNELDEQIQTNKIQINKHANNDQSLNSLSIGKHSYLKKLQKIIKSKELDLQEVNMILDSINMRIGATGKMRVNLFNQYFKQILNVGFTVLYRYMLWSASEAKHAFAEKSSFSDWFNQQQFNLTENQKLELQKYRQTLIQCNQSFNQIVSKLTSLKKKLNQKQQLMEMETDILRNTLTPLQCSQFIIFIEKYKYRQELDIYYNEKKLSQNQQQLQKITKKVKTQ